jgi:hypothetical protein
VEFVQNPKAARVGAWWFFVRLRRWKQTPNYFIRKERRMICNTLANAQVLSADSIKLTAANNIESRRK